MKKTLAFEWGNEKRVKISDPGHSDSLFYEGYRQALAGVVEIMLASSAYRVDLESGLISNEGENVSDYNYPNNIIVFSGERGAGKSSAMLTFVEGLKNSKSGLYCDSFLEDMLRSELPDSIVSLYSVKNMFDNAEFISLSPIDPTTLEADGQILPMILSRMLRKFKEEWDKLPSNSLDRSLNVKNSLLRSFESCYQHICAIKKIGSQNKDYEKLDAIMDLGDSSHLKQDLIKLVQELLKFCTGKSSNKSSAYLVLMIDDTDVNIEQAYKILEDIRKYLIIPQLIIVMASDLNHLVQVIKHNFLKSYDKEVPGRMGTVEDMTHKYIAKLFPQTRQIILPELGTYFKEHPQNISLCYKVQNPNKNSNEEKENRILPDQNKEISDFQKQIFRLIYRKTGLIFLSHQRKLHFIIPDNMRLLGHFLSMLVQMKDVCDPDKSNPHFFLDKNVELKDHIVELQSRLQNLQRFREYLLNTWVPNNLRFEQAQEIRNLDGIDMFQKVQFVCECVLSHLSQVSQIEYNYANMVALLNYYEKTDTDPYTKKFVFAIHTYFSLLGHCIVSETLIDYYDEKKVPPSVPGCSFIRLYDIYGSRVFPVSTLATKSQSSSKIEVNQEKYVVFPREFNKTDKSLSSDTITLRLGWEAKTPVMDSSTPADTMASILYSLFIDYNAPGSKSTHTANLCTAFINTLYIYESEWQSSFAKTRSSENLVPPSGRLTNWEIAQNNSLIAILNWDLQRRIGEAVLSISTSSTSEIAHKYTLEDLPIWLKKFCDKLVTSEFVPSNTGIESVEELKLSEWAKIILQTSMMFPKEKGASDDAGLSETTSSEKRMESWLDEIFAQERSVPSNRATKKSESSGDVKKQKNKKNK